MKRSSFLAGFLCGVLCFGGAPALAAVTAEPSWQPIYVDGEQVEMTAYNIGGSNFVKLRDIGRAVGFNVYWEDGVRVDSSAAYTGESPLSAAPDGTVEDFREEIARLTNDLRRSAGVQALEVSPLLSQAAQVRAEEMASAVCYSHTRPDGRAAATVTDSAGTGENIHRLSDRCLQARGQTVAQAAVAEWAASGSHRDNLLSSRYGAMGVGLARGVNSNGEACWYCVQIFLLEGCTVTYVDEPAA